ncbi:Citron Rho-interacting kinase [Manis javanica]|nr:Citron Rho-interacting kinase [Manis javanica]
MPPRGNPQMLQAIETVTCTSRHPSHLALTSFSGICCFSVSLCGDEHSIHLRSPVLESGTWSHRAQATWLSSCICLQTPASASGHEGPHPGFGCSPLKHPEHTLS